MANTLAKSESRNFWGWGQTDVRLAPAEEQAIDVVAANVNPGGGKAVSEPQLDDFELRKPRLTPPSNLAAIISTSQYDRLSHSFGKSFADITRMVMRSVPEPPDMVAFPKSEQDIINLLNWASDNNVAAIPFGGGTSVCGGVEPDVGDSYSATLTIDMQHLDQVLEIDRTSRAARIQAGASGPILEGQLRSHDLTLRFFPQSFEFSTLGGWIATRAGGHYASVYTHIDDLVESTRTVTPRGVMETRRLPGSGAGVSGDRLMLGSEGTLGLVTEAWMRLQDRPEFRASASVAFDTMTQGTEAVRALSQSGLFPTNCRLLDPAEVKANNVGDGKSATLVLGFESADHSLEAWMARAMELVGDHGGRFDPQSVQQSMQGAATHRQGAAGAWRDAFIRAPYYRDRMVRLGVIVDTFESAITWDRFDDFYRGVLQQTGDAIRRITGHAGSVSCRFTHIYPDGVAPYFTFYARGTNNGDMASMLDKWCQIKLAANETIAVLGGTVTHHHAVGRDHRTGYEAQTSPLFRSALAGAKQQLDPAGILNPGVLIDPTDRTVGIRGALKDAVDHSTGQ